MTNTKKEIDPQDVDGLQGLVKELEEVAPKELNDAICDIIDIGGRSTAVLIDKLPEMSEKVGSSVVQKLEDFFYFHPEKGSKVVERLKKAVKEAPKAYRAGLLSALSDILEATDETGNEICSMSEEAMSVLLSDVDMPRIGKAIEILVGAGERKSIPHIIKLMIKNIDRLDKFENYQFIENSLLALKSLGGEAVLRLLVNPQSDSAMKQLRIEWRTVDEQLLNDTLVALQSLDSDFAQVMIKVVDLSEFNLPFASMLNEGIKHSDKWVRQTAVEALQKTTESITPDDLAKMLSDPASEVRLMAVTSLGAFGKTQTGDLLVSLAGRPEEAMDVRLNALYALYSQGNLEGLQQIAVQNDNASITMNAEGLACMLMPHEQGVERMLRIFVGANESLLPEATHYLSELVVPEDIGAMAAAYSSFNSVQREKLLAFMGSFIEKNDGPRLAAAFANLAPAEQTALKMLLPEKGQKKQVEGHENADDACHCGCGHHHHHH